MGIKMLSMCPHLVQHVCGHWFIDVMKINDMMHQASEKHAREEIQLENEEEQQRKGAEKHAHCS